MINASVNVSDTGSNNSTVSGLYQRITSIKGSRVLLALGGWTDSSGDKYSRLVSSGAARRKFAAGAVNYLKKHNFDGLSVEWSYPKCWQSECKKGPDSDKPNFTKLVQELRQEFEKQKPPLLLTVALSGYKEVIDQAYEVREISRAVDFMSVMTYDYHGAWEPKAGHIAPLFGAPGDSNSYYNVVSISFDRAKARRSSLITDRSDDTTIFRNVPELHHELPRRPRCREDEASSRYPDVRSILPTRDGEPS